VFPLVAAMWIGRNSPCLPLHRSGSAPNSNNILTIP
jgi:hypothetical protein